TAEIADMRDCNRAGLHRENNLPRLAVVVEVESSVDSLVGALLLLRWPRPDKPEGPPLELVGVGCRQGLGTIKINRFPDHLECLDHVVSKRITKAVPNQVDGEMGDVNTDPAALEALRDGNGSPASAEWIQDCIAFIAARADDPI